MTQLHAAPTERGRGIAAQLDFGSRVVAERLRWICFSALVAIGSIFLPWVVVDGKGGGYQSIHGLGGTVAHSGVCSLLLVVVCGLTVAACVGWFVTRRPGFAVAVAFGPPLMLVLTIVNALVLANGALASVGVGAFFAGLAALVAGVLAIAGASAALRPSGGSWYLTERALWVCAGALAAISSMFMPWGVISISSNGDPNIKNLYGSIHGLTDHYNSYPHSVVWSVVLVVACMLTILAWIAWFITRSPGAARVAAFGPLLVLAATVGNAISLFINFTSEVRLLIPPNELGSNHPTTGGGAFFAVVVAIGISILASAIARDASPKTGRSY